MKRGQKRLVNGIPQSYDKFTVKDIEKILSDIQFSGKKNKNEFIIQGYCGIGQYMRVSCGYDEFQKLLCREIGYDPNIWQMEEFISRNDMDEENELEYKKCKEGDGIMTGPEYFWYNYCRVNGELPLPGSWSEDAFKSYQGSVRRKRSILSKRSYALRDIYWRYAEQPLTAEESFYKIEL